MAAISSPARYRNEPLQELPGSNLRLMCSYGGHIMPRHHHNSLSYIGGDTRIIAVDRNSSLNSLCTHLSRTLLHGRPFTLKYHLPNEDLDNLITVLSDEDLQNMIEEYDRLPSKPSRSRLRMFLFFSKPDTAVSMGTFIDVNSDDSWFVEALNNSGILARVVSDSAAAVVDCLVNLHDLELESHDQETVAHHGNKHDLLDVLKFPVEDNISSDESSSLSYSISNLPPLRVHVDDEDVDTFGVKQLDDALAISSAPPPDDDDDDVSDNRKPPLPLRILPPRTGGGGGLGLLSPCSAASDNSSSIASAKTVVYYKEDQLVHAAHVDLPDNNIKTGDQVQNQQQLDQNQQFNTHQQQHQFVYVHHPHPVGGQVPISSYYSVYAAAPTSQQQYPVYVMPAGSTQPYNIANLQPNIAADPNVVASVRQIIPQSDVAPIFYKPPLASNPSFIQIPSNQFQQHQYVNLPQSIAMPPSATANYEYGGSIQEQVYYTQHDHHQQYQSMTPAALSDVHNRSSQPV